MHLQGIIIKKQNAMLDPTMDKPERIITLSDSELPEIKDWDINKRYTITLDVVQKSKNAEGDDGVTADFKILKVTPGKSDDTSEMEKEPVKQENGDENEEGDEEINYDDYENIDDAMLNSKPVKKK
mgnify:CR=1 FL=1